MKPARCPATHAARSPAHESNGRSKRSCYRGRDRSSRDNNGVNAAREDVKTPVIADQRVVEIGPYFQTPAVTRIPKSHSCAGAGESLATLPLPRIAPSRKDRKFVTIPVAAEWGAR
jgi:hypothetical protein